MGFAFAKPTNKTPPKAEIKSAEMKAAAMWIFFTANPNNNMLNHPLFFAVV
jgi:hypothetical protein